MAMGHFNSGGSSAPMSEINTTPLVDVMLVLLIIFIITAPLMTHAVKVDLPSTQSAPRVEKAATLTVSITAHNLVYIDHDPIALNALESYFRKAVAQDPQVEIHLHADKATRYETVAETMSAARRAGISKMGFVTQPGHIATTPTP